jgi:hypothetical protein
MLQSMAHCNDDFHNNDLRDDLHADDERGDNGDLFEGDLFVESPVVNRQARALRILKCLQSGPSFNAKELSQILQVSERTIYRDIRLIRSAGIDVNYDEQQGAYRVESDATPVIGSAKLSQEDIARVVMAAHFSFLQNFSDFAESSRELLTRALAHHPPALQNSISRMLNACTIETNDGGSVELLERLLTAVRTQRWLRLQYRFESPDSRLSSSERVRGETVRDESLGGEELNEWTRFAPYHIVASPMREWKVEGKSAVHSAVVTIQFSNIITCELTDDRFRLPRAYRNRVKDRQGQPPQVTDATSRERPEPRRLGRAARAASRKSA